MKNKILTMTLMILIVFEIFAITNSTYAVCTNCSNPNTWGHESCTAWVYTPNSDGSTHKISCCDGYTVFGYSVAHSYNNYISAGPEGHYLGRCICGATKKVGEIIPHNYTTTTDSIGTKYDCQNCSYFYYEGKLIAYIPASEKAAYYTINNTSSRPMSVNIDLYAVTNADKAYDSNLLEYTDSIPANTTRTYLYYLTSSEYGSLKRIAILGYTDNKNSTGKLLMMAGPRASSNYTMIYTTDKYTTYVGNVVEQWTEMSTSDKAVSLCAGDVISENTRLASSERTSTSYPEYFAVAGTTRTELEHIYKYGAVTLEYEVPDSVAPTVEANDISYGAAANISLTDSDSGIRYWGVTNSTSAPTSTGSSNATTGNTLNYWYPIANSTATQTVTFTGLNAGTYYAWGKDADGNTGYKQFIVGKAPTPTAPTAKSLTYTGSAQSLANAGGSAVTWYYKIGTALTSSNYSKTGSTTIPTATTAGSYNVYYYTPGNTNYNASAGSLYVTTTIGKKSASISYGTTSVNKTYGNAAFTNPLTNTGDGSVTYASSATGVVTVNSSTGAVTIVKAGSAVITATVKDGTNYTYATKTASYTVTVGKAAVGAPTNLSVSTAGVVTWTAGSNATGYQISIDGSNWTSASSGVNYNSTITGSTGSRTVYVRSVNSDSTNYSTPSSNATKAVTVYQLTLNKGTGISSVSGAGKYISGRSVSISATASSGYAFSSWTKTAGSSPASTTAASTTVTVSAATTLTANARATVLAFSAQTLTAGTYNTSYSKAFTGASGGTGTYTYAINSVTCGGTAVTASSGKYNGLSLSSTTISGTPTKAGTYVFNIKATDSSSGATGSANITIVINKAAVGAPTNLAVSTAGVVTWTAGSNATGYQISIDGSNWTSASSGVNYNSTITGSTGSRTVYVRSVNSDSTNYSTPSSNATKAVTVYQLTLNKGTGISSVSGAGKYISGRSVSISATASTGYTWSKWTVGAGSSPASATTASTTVTVSAATTLTATATANALTFPAQSKSFAYSTSSQTVTITGASNGTGTYTYSEVSEKNSAGTGTSYITISGTTITIAASTLPGTYAYTVRATDSNSGVTKDAVITITVTAPTVKVIFYRNQFSSDTTTVEKSYTYGASGNAFQSNNFTKTGYTLAGWSETRGATSATYTITNGIADSWLLSKYPSVNLYAVWKPNTNTVYKVEHYQMNLDGSTYTLKDTDNLTGTSDASITPGVKNYTGFTAPATQTTTVSPDGSRVVKYYYTRNKYYFDLNGWLDGASNGGISGYGTADVYVNGSASATGVADYYQQLYYGSTYEIKNIKATTGHTYRGVHSGSLTGTVGASNISVVLSFITNNYSVNGVYYPRLAEAYASISATSGTIKVESNNTDNTVVSIASDKNIILDLNGKTITVNGITTGNFITNSGTLEMKDSVGNGAINMSTTAATGNIYIVSTPGTLTVTSGSYTVTSNEYWPTPIVLTGTVNINGGTITSTNNGTGWSAGIAAEAGTLNVKGGTINAKSTSIPDSTYAIINPGRNAAKINVTGGTLNSDGRGIVFENHSGASGNNGSSLSVSGSTEINSVRQGIYNSFATGGIVITGGIIKSTTSGSAVANQTGTLTIGTSGGSVSKTSPLIQGAGYGVSDSTSTGFKFYDGILKGVIGAYEVSATPETGYDIVNNVETIGGKIYKTAYLGTGNYSVNSLFYETLERAYAVGVTGAEGTIKVEKTNTDNSAFTVASGKKITIDLNSKIVTKTVNRINNNGELIIEDNTVNKLGTIQTADGSTNTMVDLIVSTGKIIVNSGTLINNGVKDSRYKTINGGNIVINGGTITSYYENYTNGIAIELQNGSNLEINGGLIKAKWMGAMMSASTAGHGATIKMTGGKIESKWHGFWFCGSPANSSTLEIKGGEIDAYENGVSIESNCTGNLVVTGGKITAGFLGLYNGGKGTITTGTKDKNASVDSPVIIAGSNAIVAESGFNFYDGILKAKDLMPIRVGIKVLDIETGYNIVNNTETINGVVYKTSYLGSGNYSVGDYLYETIERAYTLGVTGTEGIIKVEKSNDDNTSITIASGKNVKVNLNGKTINVTGVTVGGFIINNGKLTLEDNVGNGEIKINHGNTTDWTYIVGNNGTLDINSGTYSSENSKLANMVIYNINGTVNVNGGTINVTNSKPNSGSNMEVVFGIRSDAGTVNMKAGTINVNTTINNKYAFGIVNTAAGVSTLNVTGGNINVTSTNGAAYAVAITHYNGGAVASKINVSGSPVLVTEGKWARTVCDVIGTGGIVVTGGTIIAKGTENAYGVTSETSKVTIGTLDNTVSTEVPIIQSSTWAVEALKGFDFYDGILKAEKTAIIMSGTLNTPEGYEVVNNTETIENKVYKTAYLGQGNYSVDGMFYETLERAYTVGVTGAEGIIKVEQTNTDSSSFVVASGKTITLNTNAKTITKTASGMTNSGTLNITGNGTIKTSDAIDLIINSGTLNINGTGTISQENTTSDAHNAIENTGLTKINGNTTISAGYRAITTIGQIEINAGSVTAKEIAIRVVNAGSVVLNGGKLESTTDRAIVADSTAEKTITMTGGEILAYRYSLSANDAKQILVTGGTINAQNVGIYVTGTSNVIVGTDDNNVSRTLPVIIGAVHGIQSTNGVKFYDGIFKGAKGAMNINGETIIAEINANKLATLPVDYEIVKGTETISGTVYETAVLKITPILTANPASVTMIYGDTNNVTITYNGDGELKVVPSDKNVVTTTLATKIIAVKSENVGDATVTVTALETADYATKTITVPVVVNKKDITATWKNTDLLFKNKDIGPTVTTPINGVYGELLNLTVTGQQTNVGTHTATVTISKVTGGKEDPANYNITNPTQVYTISPDPSIKFVISLDKTVYDYEGKEHTPTETVKATVDGKEVTLIKDTDYTVTYTDNKDAGTATVTITGIKNYGASKGSITFTINKIDLTIIPHKNQSKEQGSPDPELKYSYTGNVTGEKPGFSGALSREPGEEVGFYKINQGTLGIVDNLPFKVKNYNLVFGDPNVIFTIEYINPMILEWTVPANVDGAGNGTTVKLPIPLSKRNKYMVMWGDGTTEMFSGKEFPTHNYKNSDLQRYEVRVSGSVDFFGYYRDIEPTSTNIYSDYVTYTQYLTALKDWGDIGATRIGFAQCENLAGTIPEVTGLEDITSAENMFNGCEKLVGPIPSDLLTSSTKINSAKNLFKNCISLKGEIPAGLFANNPDVTSYENVFYNCKTLEGEIPTGLFEQGKEVLSYAGAFYNCGGLEGEIPEGLFANSTKVQSFRETFANCVKLQSPAANADGVTPIIPEDLFEYNRYVLNYYRTFYNCIGLKGDVTNTMFDSNAVIIEIPEDTTINNNYRGTFEGCTGVENVNVPIPIVGHEMFRGCTSLKSITLTKANDIGNNAFYGCNTLTNIKCSNSYLVNIGADAFEYTGTNPEILPTYINSDCKTLVNYSWPDDKRLVDVEAPKGTVEIIVDKDPFTKVREVTLEISVKDNISKAENCKMAIINEVDYYENIDLDTLNWQNFAESVAWTLTENDGIKTVYVFFKDEFGNVQKINKEVAY